ncbi:MAG: ABC transporter permease [Propionibacteriaceae bacterium]|jgi:peptide/nickel transport system permease protein|nr:ABC transporter permease [Propionibacteriaceae bacterium]
MSISAAVIRRLAVFLATLLIASLIIFTLVQALPGNVAQATLGMGATPEAVAELSRRWGLDQPFINRYWDWLFALIQGDLGHSYATGLGVGQQLAPRLGVTAWLLVWSLPIACAVALPLGMMAAMWRRRRRGFVVNAITQVGFAVPVFFAGSILVIVFALKLGWLPANGYVSITSSPAAWASHLLLPVATIAIVQACFFARYVRSSFIDVMVEDYYRTARAIGWTRWRGLIRHGLRNAATSLLTVVGLQVANLLVGAILVEKVFVLPGLGSLLMSAVAAHDLAVVQVIVMLLVAVVLLINLLVDIAYLLVDPRLAGRAGGGL